MQAIILTVTQLAIEKIGEKGEWKMLKKVGMLLATVAILAMSVMQTEAANETEMVNAQTSLQFEEDYLINSNFLLEEDTVIESNLVLQSGTLDLNGHTLTVNGNVSILGGVVRISGGTLDAKGDFTIGTCEEDNKSGNYYSATSKGMLVMSNEADMIKVGGDFEVCSSYASTLTNGTLYIEGDFAQYGTYKYTNSSYAYFGNFSAGSNHSVEFSKDKNHKIYFDSENSGFTKVDFGNGEIEILSPIRGFTLYQNAEWNLKLSENKLSIVKNALDLNGYTLTINSDLDLVKGAVSIGSGCLNVKGNLNLRDDKIDVGTGSLNVSGNFSIGTYKKEEGSTVATSKGVLIMNAPEALVKVGGNFEINTSKASTLTNGRMYIEGDFAQYGTYKYTSASYAFYGNFAAEGNHLVEFSKDKNHKVYFESTQSGFGKVDFGNGEIELLSAIRGFTLYQDAEWNLKLADDVLKIEKYALELNGYTLKINNNVNLADGSVNIGSGCLQIKGNLNLTGDEINVGTGSLEVSGNLSLGNKKVEDGNTLSTSKAKLIMSEEKAEVKVGGNFEVCNSISSTLTNGRMYIGGDFAQYGTYKYTNSTYAFAGNFKASGNHLVAFSKGKEHKIHFDSTSSSFQKFLCTDAMDMYTFEPESPWKELVDGCGPVFGDKQGIIIGDDNWNGLMNQITYDRIYTNVPKISIVGSDELSSIIEYAYYLDKSGDGKVLTTKELDACDFVTAEDGVVSITEDGKYVIYAVAVDEAGNKSDYICTDGFIVDTKVYTIDYVLNGGIQNIENPVSYTRSKDDIPLKAPERKGYSFCGWYADTNYQEQITMISASAPKDITLFAKWETIKYTITYELNGGKLTGENPDTYDVTTPDITMGEPLRCGYTFDGWYADSNLSVKDSAKIPQGSTGNKTFYAKWVSGGKEHYWNGGVVTKEAAVGVEGTRTYTCEVCGKTKEERIPALLPVPSKPYKIANVVSGVHVYWNAVDGASKYGLWRSENNKNGTYKWIANPTVPHFTDTKVETGKTYYYKVSCMIGSSTVHSEKSEPIGITYVSTPDISTRENKAAGIQLGWKKVEGATGYGIYRKSYEGNDAWVRVGTVEGNSTFTWTDTSVKNNNGTIYKYTIRALAGSDRKTLSGCRNAGRTMVRLSSQVLNSAAKTNATSIKCNWTTSSKVTGYEVRFVADGKVYKTFTVGNYKTGTKTFTGLKSGKTYKIQVRSYKKVDGVGSFYSAWSTAKSVGL